MSLASELTLKLSKESKETGSSQNLLLCEVIARGNATRKTALGTWLQPLAFPQSGENPEIKVREMFEKQIQSAAVIKS